MNWHYFCLTQLASWERSNFRKIVLKYERELINHVTIQCTAVKSRIHHRQLRLLLWFVYDNLLYCHPLWLNSVDNQCWCTLTITASHPPAPYRLVGGARAKPHCTCRCLSLITQITSAVLIGCAAARAVREHKQLAFYSQVLVFFVQISCSYLLLQPCRLK